VALWRRFDASGCMRAPVDPLRPSCGLQSAITALLPQKPHTLHRALVRKLGHPLAGVGVTVPDDQVHMRVAGISAGGVNGRQPSRLVLGQIVGESPDQALPVLRGKLARQSHDNPVNDAGILAVGFLLRIEPRPGRVRITG